MQTSTVADFQASRNGKAFDVPSNAARTSAVRLHLAGVRCAGVRGDAWPV